MAADDLMELKEAILAGMQRQIEKAMLGVAPVENPGLGSGTAMADTAQAFSTGYDGTNTTLPFTTDFSIVGGPDIVVG